jgi:omega-6 fatty acid desaturase / acyl-lipid omega-6 desaturase (Delta-12 desaturase)
MPKKP